MEADKLKKRRINLLINNFHIICMPLASAITQHALSLLSMLNFNIIIKRQSVFQIISNIKIFHLN